MYPHEKKGYVDACRKAGVCPAVYDQEGEMVYCDLEMHSRNTWGATLHAGEGQWGRFPWTLEDARALGFGAL